MAEGLAPIGTIKARILILGSMPSIRSIEVREYYANPRNTFWTIMSVLFSRSLDDYDSKVRLIEEKRLALWDVLKACDRFGSLDSNIKSTSIEVNDFAPFLRQHQLLKCIFFNGLRAETEFRKRVLPGLPSEVSGGLYLDRLPSTSPAMASLPTAAKIEFWTKAVQPWMRGVT